MTDQDNGTEPEVTGAEPEAGSESVTEAATEAVETNATDAADAAIDPDAAADPDAEETGEVVENPDHKWYVVHTYSGYENRAKKSLEERIKQNNLDEFFGEVLIPTENVMELGKGGQKKTTKRKFFPGYMLVCMELTDETWHLVKATPKITGFVGSATRPPSIPESEVRRLTRQIDEGTLKPKPRVQFEDGENVRVVDGPFQNFNGVVDAVNAEKGRVRVLVSIFGRSTPVELEFVQVEKA